MLGYCLMTNHVHFVVVPECADGWEQVTWMGTNQVSKRVFSGYDRYNNVTEAKEYDYGAGVPGALLRRTVTNFVTGDYDALGATADGTVHNRQLAATREVYATESGGTALARTEYYYDGATESSSVRVAPADVAAAGHDTLTTEPRRTARGNLTRMRRRRDSGGSVYLAVSGTYDSTGNLLTRTDERLNTTSYSYADNGDGGGSAYAHVTLVTLPAAKAGQTAMTESYRWDYYLGAPLNRTDANGQMTTYSFESAANTLDRLLSVQQPDGGVTSYGYCDTPTLGCSWSGISLPGNSVGSTQTFWTGITLAGYTA